MYAHIHITISSFTDEKDRALRIIFSVTQRARDLVQSLGLSFASSAVWKVRFLVSQGGGVQNLTGYANFNLPIRHSYEGEIGQLDISMNFNKIRAGFSSLDELCHL